MFPYKHCLSLTNITNSLVVHSYKAIDKNVRLSCSVELDHNEVTKPATSCFKLIVKNFHKYLGQKIKRIFLKLGLSKRDLSQQALNM